MKGAIEPIFRGIQAGDLTSLESLFGWLYPLIYRVAVRCRPDDNGQAAGMALEAFARLWKEHANIKHDSEIKSTLLTAIREQLPDVTDDSLERVVIEEEVLLILYANIHSLPVQDAKVIRYTALGHNNNEIAEEFGIPVSMVKTIKCNALNSFRKMLKIHAGELTQYYRVARLIASRLSGAHTPMEDEELDRWLAADPVHPERYTWISERFRNLPDNYYLDEQQVRDQWNRLQERL